MIVQIETKEILSEVEEITLAHMQIALDPADFLIHNPTYAGKKLAIWLVQQFYKTEIERIGKFSSGDTPINNSLLKKALAIAKWHSVNHASNVLPSVVDASVLTLLNDAERSGWYHHVDDEFDTLEELLASIVEDAVEQTPKHYNYSFIIKELIPLARQMGIDPDTILVAAAQAKKVNILVPAARQLLTAHHDKKLSTSDVKSSLKWILEMAADKDISASVMRDEMNRFRGISDSREPVKGNVFLLSEGRSLMVIEINDQRTHRAIENALMHKVDFRFGEIGELLKLLLPKNVQDNFSADRITQMLKGGKQ